MPSSLNLLVVTLVLAPGPSGAAAPDSQKKLLELRSLVQDANFRNDPVKLRALSKEISTLIADKNVGPFALYEAGWADWAVFNAEFVAGRKQESAAAVSSALDRFRRAVALMPEDADAHAMLANVLISAAISSPDGIRTYGPELARIRRRALKLGPKNPRVVLMDAGMIFNTPPERGGSQEEGLQRWLEAVELFEGEARTSPPHPLSPRWGRTLAYGWMSDLYLAFKPPRTAEARKAAETALKLRPDFWYVKERVLPRLKD
jgi:tetratricopeptide (TPR) repeat protein